MNSSTNNTNHHPTSFSPYLLSRFHQHLNHLNDMAFAHTKILQEMIEKRSIQSLNSSPHGSISSSSPTSTSSTTVDSNQQQQQRKRSYPCHDDQQEIKNENKRPRKQSKPQQLVKITQHHHERSSSSPSSSTTTPSGSEHDDDEDEEEMGEINESIEKQKSLPIPSSSSMLPFSPSNLPFFNYIQDLARANHINSPISMGKFVENVQKELFNAAIESKQITPPLLPPMPLPPGLFPQTVHHHHHHPYFSQILFNNSFINHFQSSASLPRFPHTPTDDHPFHFSTPKKRRTKVTDTRLSPRITSKLTPQSNFDDLTDEDISSVDDNPPKSEQPSVEYNGFQMANLTSLHLRKAKLMFFYTRYPNSGVLKVYFPDVRFNKGNTAQLVKWFSNFREFFYQQIEKYARQCLAEGIRKLEDLIVTPNCELNRVLNLHYNRSNQINAPISFQKATQGALREFFLSIQQQKDQESSWKKTIYKVMQQYEDQIPDFFKNDHWMHSI